MEIKELRVGNLVHQPVTEDGGWGLLIIESIMGSTLKVFAHNKNKEHLLEFKLSELSGIELTPEWLTRLGWVWNPECNSWEKYPNGDARMHLKFHDVNASYTMFNYVLRATIAERIYYVHQLQNLYYAMCGEELAIDKTSLKN